MPDGCGEGEESLAGAGEDSGRCPASVLFQAELAFERVENGLDPLTDTGQSAVPYRFVLPVRAHQMDPRSVKVRLELPPGEALVGEDHLPGADEVMVAPAVAVSGVFGAIIKGYNLKPSDRLVPGGEGDACGVGIPACLGKAAKRSCPSASSCLRPASACRTSGTPA